MSIKPWTRSITAFLNHRWISGLLLTLYYLAIILGLIWMYGKGDFSTPPFIYQGF